MMTVCVGLPPYPPGDPTCCLNSPLWLGYGSLNLPLTNAKYQPQNLEKHRKLHVKMNLGALSPARDALRSHQTLSITCQNGPRSALACTRRTPEPPHPVNCVSKCNLECFRLHETHSGATKPCKLYFKMHLGVLSSARDALQRHRTI